MSERTLSLLSQVLPGGLPQVASRSFQALMDRTREPRLVGRRPVVSSRPDEREPWVQAEGAWIERALELVSRKPSGGWFAVDATKRISTTPTKYTILGQELVAWRKPTNRDVVVAPARCPHLGADLSEGLVTPEGHLRCPWHGMTLRAERKEGRENTNEAAAWKPFRSYDDGLLVWVQLPKSGEPPSEKPLALVVRPTGPSVAGVVSKTVCSEVQDVLATRFDATHAAPFHPYSFARVRILRRESDHLRILVTCRIVGPFCAEAEASLHCPDARTIVMTIVGGEGVGSVVATHATPVRDGQVTVIETAIITSDRPGFQRSSWWHPVAQRALEYRTQKLWDDDGAYAERRYQLRQHHIHRD